MNAIFLIIGLPGSGKDFVSRSILEYYRENCLRCCIGDKLRQMKATNSTGELSSIGEVEKILSGFLQQKANVYIIDGFPRSEEQLHILQRLAPPNFKICTIILECSDTIARNRIAERFVCPKCMRSMCEKKCPCGHICVQRGDDLSDQAVDKRIEIYTDFFPRILDSLKYKSIPAYRVNSELPQEKVREKILEIVENIH